MTPIRIGLVGCVKDKKRLRSPARDLYRSALFRGRRGYVERFCDIWFILSAKHGLLDPDKPIDYYDETLKGQSRKKLSEWASRVLKALDSRFGDFSTSTFEIHTGAEYREYGLIEGLLERGATVEIPLRGLSFGEQLAFYKKVRSK